MKNLKMYCVTDKVVNFLNDTNYNIGWVGKDKSPKNYINCKKTFQIRMGPGQSWAQRPNGR